MNAAEFLSTVPPFSGLSPDDLARIAGDFTPRQAAPGTALYRAGETVEGLHVVVSGRVAIADAATPNETLALLGPRDLLGTRAVTTNGVAGVTAVALEDTTVLVLPRERFRAAAASHPQIDTFFARRQPARRPAQGIAETRVEALMSSDPAFVAPSTPVKEAARILRDRKISSLLVRDGERLAGILTVRDISGRVVAAGIDPSVPVADVMTADPITLTADALGSDVLHTMVERNISHLPVVGPKGLVGIITKTDHQPRFPGTGTSPHDLIATCRQRRTLAPIAAVTARMVSGPPRTSSVGHSLRADRQVRETATRL